MEAYIEGTEPGAAEIESEGELVKEVPDKVDDDDFLNCKGLKLHTLLMGFLGYLNLWGIIPKTNNLVFFKDTLIIWWWKYGSS